MVECTPDWAASPERVLTEALLGGSLLPAPIALSPFASCSLAFFHPCYFLIFSMFPFHFSLLLSPFYLNFFFVFFFSGIFSPLKVSVIPKEGWVLLVWHRLRPLRTFLHDTAQLRLIGSDYLPQWTRDESVTDHTHNTLRTKSPIDRSRHLTILQYKCIPSLTIG